MLVALYELLDGHEVLRNLSNEIEQELGKAQRDQIFNGIELPPLGTTATEKPKITQQLMESLELKVDKETCKNLLSRPLHRLSDKYLRTVREKFLQSKDIDDFLKKEHQDIVARLEQHMKDGTLFFTQEVDKQVVDFVRQDPQIMVGIRQGEKISTTKIPYMTKQYLNESNEQLKKYHYCHCFWVREAIKSGANEISPTFCYCSAGFKKQFWDAALGQPVKVEVVESILKGDSVCTFIIHLPKEIVDQVDKKD
jgi:hypothetical protein